MPVQKVPRPAARQLDLHGIKDHPEGNPGDLLPLTDRGDRRCLHIDRLAPFLPCRLLLRLLQKGVKNGQERTAPVRDRFLVKLIRQTFGKSGIRKKLIPCLGPHLGGEDDRTGVQPWQEPPGTTGGKDHRRLKEPQQLFGPFVGVSHPNTGVAEDEWFPPEPPFHQSDVAGSNRRLTNDLLEEWAQFLLEGVNQSDHRLPSP